MFTAPSNQDDGPIDEHSVVELTDEGRAIMLKLLAVLSDAVGRPVSGTDVAGAFRLARERHGFELDLENQDHVRILLAALAETPGTAED